MLMMIDVILQKLIILYNSRRKHVETLDLSLSLFFDLCILIFLHQNYSYLPIIYLCFWIESLSKQKKGTEEKERIIRNCSEITPTFIANKPSP